MLFRSGEVKNEEVHHYYQMANVFVSASDSESQGLTYDEALASDLPIVVMRSVYTDELIDDPAIGVSFQKRADLVKGVIYYLDHPDDEESHTKRQEKLHAISAEVFAQRVVAFYRDCQDKMAEEEEIKAQLKAQHRHHLFHRLRS